MTKAILSIGFHEGCFTHVQLVYDYGILSISKDSVERAADAAFLYDDYDDEKFAEFVKTLDAANINPLEIEMIIVSHDGEVRRSIPGRMIADALAARQVEAVE